MNVAIELMEKMATRELDKYNAIRQIEDYVEARITAQLCSHQNDEGALARLKAQKLEDKLKVTVRLLHNVDSMTYYPMVLGDKRFTSISERAEVIRHLIKELNNE